MRRAASLFLCLLFLLAACSTREMRGLSGEQYVSTSRPAIMVSANDLKLRGSEHRMLKLMDVGVLGGLSIESWITVYGNDEGPILVVAQADLPPGWRWDANMSHPFIVDETWIDRDGIALFGQSFTDRLGKNPFVHEEAASVEGKAVFPLWMVRAYSARFNDNRSKLIIEYREKAPAGVTTLARLPLGQADLLRLFADRAEKAFTLQKNPPRPSACITMPIPSLSSRFLDTNFFGTASPVDYWRYR